MWPDWAIYSTLGNFSKPLATINLPKSLTFLGNFCNVSKSLILLVKSFLATFYWSHCLDSTRSLFYLKNPPPNYLKPQSNPRVKSSMPRDCGVRAAFDSCFSLQDHSVPCVWFFLNTLVLPPNLITTISCTIRTHFKYQTLICFFASTNILSNLILSNLTAKCHFDWAVDFLRKLD